MLVTLEELTPEQCEANRTIRLQEKGWYEFDPPVEALPFERKFKGVPHGDEPLHFTIGQYLGYRPRSEEHMFYARAEDGNWHLVPLFLGDQADQTRATRCPDDAPAGT